jgi:hypothetical protein
VGKASAGATDMVRFREVAWGASASGSLTSLMGSGSG